MSRPSPPGTRRRRPLPSHALVKTPPPSQILDYYKPQLPPPDPELVDDGRLRVRAAGVRPRGAAAHAFCAMTRSPSLCDASYCHSRNHPPAPTTPTPAGRHLHAPAGQPLPDAREPGPGTARRAAALLAAPARLCSRRSRRVQRFAAAPACRHIYTQPRTQLHTCSHTRTQTHRCGPGAPNSRSQRARAAGAAPPACATSSGATRCATWQWPPTRTCWCARRRRRARTRAAAIGAYRAWRVHPPPAPCCRQH